MVISATPYLRPAADDYCFGSNTAEYGIVGGVIYWWNHMSGFAFSLSLGSLFVGLPLVMLPFWLASAIPFLCAAFAMGILLVGISNIETKLIYKIVFIFFVAFCWWAFLWAPMSLGDAWYFGRSETNGLTFWQTLNGTYVIQLQILLCLYALANRSALVFQVRSLGDSANFLFLVCLTGVLAGFAGTALSVSIIAFCILMLIALQFFSIEAKVFWRRYWLLLGVVTLISLAICHSQSPGNALREQAITANLDYSFEQIFDILLTSALQGLRKWLKLYLHLGSIILLSLICGFQYLMMSLRLLSIRVDGLYFGLAFSAFALLQCCVSRLADQLTYVAYWHYISALVCVFLSIYFFASKIASWLHQKSSNNQYVMPGVAAIFIAAIIVGIYASSLMMQEMRQRSQAWDRGPANLEGVSDIEDPTGWQMDCWKKLDAHRDSKTFRK